MMLTHLSEEQFAQLAAGHGGDGATGHLETCLECRERLQAWRNDLHRLRSDLLQGAERSDIYWHSQRNAIMRRLDATGSAKHIGWNLGWSLACYALALSLLVLAFLNFQGARNGIGPAPDVSDAKLLQEVEDRINEDHPDALVPTDLLVSEMSGQSAELNGQNIQQASVQQAKVKRVRKPR
jgi:hypothetical protein